MSDTSAFGFGKFVPGFDFLQNLTKSASGPAAATGAVPGMSSWVAPTLSVEELDKRIQELKAVQFWLEQNGTALKATIQALEVQKMTLTTLQGMNVNIAELAKAFTARAPQAPAAAPAPEPAPQATPESAPEPAPAPADAAAAAPKAKRSSKPKTDQPAADAAVDPMQWWGSLTQQFQNIASAAMQDVAAQAIKAKNDEAQPKAAASSKPARKAATRKPAGKKSAAAKTRPPRT
jgi:hypothetical protein